MAGFGVHTTFSELQLAHTLVRASPPVTTTMMVTNTVVATSTPSPMISLAAGNITISLLKLSTTGI